MNWFIPFLIGLFIGQEFQNIPRIKPIGVTLFRRAVDYSKTFEEEGNKQIQESWWSMYTPSLLKKSNHNVDDTKTSELDSQNPQK